MFLVEKESKYIYLFASTKQTSLSKGACLFFLLFIYEIKIISFTFTKAFKKLTIPSLSFLSRIDKRNVLCICVDGYLCMHNHNVVIYISTILSFRHTLIHPCCSYYYFYIFVCFLVFFFFFFYFYMMFLYYCEYASSSYT